MTYTQPPQTQPFDDLFRDQSNLIPVFNVRAYGADPYTVRDSTNAIQAALNAAASASAPAGIVYFPAGTYICSAALSIASKVSLAGAGWQASILKQTFAQSGVDTAGLLINSDTVNGNSGIEIYDLQLLCTAPVGNPETASTCAVLFKGVTDVLINRVWAQNGTLKFQPLPAKVNTPTVNSQGNNLRITIANCRGDGGAEGVFWQQGTGLTVIGCTFTNSHDSTISVNSSGEQIVISDNRLDKQSNTNPATGNIELTNDGAGDTNGIRDVTVEGNVCLNNQGSTGGHGIFLQNVAHAAVIGNTVRNCIGNGININHGSAHVTVSGNDVDVSAGGGIALLLADDTAGATTIAITGNTISSASTGQNALVLGSNSGNGLTDVTCTGNVVIATVNSGISLNTSATSCIVADNVCSSLAVFTATGWVTRGNVGFNPVGVVTPGVPASGSAVAADIKDRSFYITTGAGATTIAIQNGPTITLAASTAGQHVLVPAQKTMTPTYANAPTWVVEAL